MNYEQLKKAYREQKQAAKVDVDGIGSMTVRMMSAMDAVEAEMSLKKVLGEPDEKGISKVEDREGWIAFCIDLAATCCVDENGDLYPPEAKKEVFSNLDGDQLRQLQEAIFKLNEIGESSDVEDNDDDNDDDSDTEGNDDPSPTES